MAAKDAKCTNVAAIFGVTGLVGKELARRLLTRGWKVYGVARGPDTSMAISGHRGFHFISCDLLDSYEAQDKLSRMNDVTHAFWVTWASQFPLDSPECYEENRAMMANALVALLPRTESLKHVSLQTGAKHYIALQGTSLDGEVGCYAEDSPRVNIGHNFYYGLEDLLQEMLPLYKVAWSIHRPGFIIGSSRRAFYNLMGTICVYGTICKYLNLPFVFGGTKMCWEEMYMDASDARLVADQHVFVATRHEGGGEGQAYNAINGECFTWKEIWPVIGAKLGVKTSENYMFSGDFMYSLALAGKEGVWKEIVEKEGLVESELNELANWDFLDQMFRCPLKMLCSRSKIDLIGFKSRYHVLDSMVYWIDVMRDDKLIP